jgi:hypothetical protein
MTPDQRKKYLEEAISQLQGELRSLDEKLQARSRNLGFVGEKLRLLPWAPEVSGMIPQLFSWNPEQDPSVEEVVSTLLLREQGATAEVMLKTGSVVLSYKIGRLWISSASSDTLLEAIEIWGLSVGDYSHGWEKLEALKEQTQVLGDYLLKLFPLREVPPLEEVSNVHFLDSRPRQR